MRFRILGPVEAWHDGRRLALGGPQQRALLAVLLLDANRVVSSERLIADLWGERTPADVRGLLYGCVTRLRRVLRPLGGPGSAGPLLSRSGGYLLAVQPDELDLHGVERLEAAARAALAEGGRDGLDRAAGLLAEALALWRGPSLDGVAQAACRAQAARLDEQRLSLLERRIDIDLELGRHDHLAGELELHLAANPLRERLWTQLMVALHATGRQADALAAYQRVRELLVEQLGVEPGATLQEIERAILLGDDAVAVYRRRQAGAVDGPPDAPAGEPAADVVTPAQLPAATAAFTGRLEHLERLDALLAGPTGAVVISAIAGTAGVGKTALAVHWAHQVRDRFPDGQLYVDLRGYAAVPPLRPIDALAGFLRALGVAADGLPTDVDQASALFRSMLAERRVLVVLDNARSAEQVRPLLPGGAGCLALVTSRDQLGGLVAREGAYRVTLDVLAPGEARALLARLLGADRVDAEWAAVAELATACAHLPLALRIAAAALTDHPHRTIASYVAELAGGDRLQALAVDDDAHSAVRATLDLSYATLPAAARRLFRLLGLVPGPDFTADAAAALLGVPVAAVRPLLDRLTAANLVSGCTSQRYRSHDLLRLYAAQRAEGEDSRDEREAAVQRLLDWYLGTADSANCLLYPGNLRLAPPPTAPAVTPFATDTEALAWLDAEWPGLLAAARYAAEHARPVAVLLSDTLRAYLTVRGDVVGGLTLAEIAVTAAEADGDRRGEAAAVLTLGSVVRVRGDSQEALRQYARCARAAEEAGWLECQVVAIGNMGVVHRQLGHVDRAVEQLNRALDIARRTGWKAGQATSLSNLGTSYLTLGRLDRAAECFGEVLAIDREAGYRIGEAIDLSDLGQIHHIQGRLDLAADHLHQALRLLRTLGHPESEAQARGMLAEVHRDAGRWPEAWEAAQAAMSAARGLRDRRHEADTMNTLASIECGRGRYVQAAGLYRQALSLARGIGAEQTAVAALVGLAVTHRHLGRLDTARPWAEEAATLANQADYRILEGRALTALADVHHAGGEPGLARPPAQRALELHRGSGYRLGEARALYVLGQACRGTGDVDAATGLWREAIELFTAIGTPEADHVRAALAQLTSQ